MNKKPFSSFRTCLIWAIAFVLAAGIGAVGAQTPGANALKYAPDKLLVRFTAGASASRKGNAHAAVGSTVLKHYDKIDGLENVKLPKGLSVQKAISLYHQN